MMLSGLDVYVGLKILVSGPPVYQKPLAKLIKVSSSSVNQSIKTLTQSRLLILKDETPVAPLKSWAEFLIVTLKYILPVSLGNISIGVPTAFGSSYITKEIPLGSSICPIWEFEDGTTQGAALPPIYPSVPKALSLFPDERLHKLLVLLDVLRLDSSRARDKEVAKRILVEVLMEIAKERNQEKSLSRDFLNKLL